MDPNTTLAEMVRLSEYLIQNEDLDEEDRLVATFELAEYTLALNDWICKGGFLPTSWQKRL